MNFLKFIINKKSGLYMVFGSFFLVFISIVSGIVKRFNFFVDLNLINFFCSINDKLFDFYLLLFILVFFIYGVRHHFIYYFVSIFFVLFSVLALGLEYINFSNYLYSVTGIILFKIRHLLVISMIVLFFVSIDDETKNKVFLKRFLFFNKKSFVFWFNLLFLLVIVLFSVSNISNSFSVIKMGYWNYFPNQYESLENMSHIPDECPVLHPSKSEKWQSMGIQQYLRFFLFPKILINSDYLSKDTVNEFDKLCFVFIKSIDGKIVWPIVDEEQRRVDLMTGNRDVIKYKSIKKMNNYYEIEL